jgi:hypothetical protein
MLFGEEGCSGNGSTSIGSFTLDNGGIYRFCAHDVDFLSSTTPFDKTVSDLFVPVVVQVLFRFTLPI